MNTSEYAKLSAVEERHWFYSGKRAIVRHWLQRTGPLKASDLLVDCGAGTGRFVEEMTSHCRAIALDDHAESLAIARGRLGRERVVEGRCTDLPFPDSSIDAITALDVLEHVDRDDLAVKQFARALKPGGLLVVTVPALPALWSDWDVVLHHHRRYTKRTLLALVSHPSLDLLHWNYVNVAALPAVWLVRMLRKLHKGTESTTGTRAEDSIPPEPLNNLLRWMFVTLACQRLVHFPLGVGLLGVWRKSPSTMPQRIASGMTHNSTLAV
jgi:ubiquinone/menaquinone biosynthesis C-methylase UbiE